MVDGISVWWTVFWSGCDGSRTNDRIRRQLTSLLKLDDRSIPTMALELRLNTLLAERVDCMEATVKLCARIAVYSSAVSAYIPTATLFHIRIFDRSYLIFYWTDRSDSACYIVGDDEAVLLVCLDPAETIPMVSKN